MSAVTQQAVDEKELALQRKMKALEMLLDKLSSLGDMIAGKKDLILSLQARLKALKGGHMANPELEAELDNIQKLLHDATTSVASLTETQLEEISKYKSPPERIKIALEAIMYLIHRKLLTWDQIKSELGKTFIPSILKFSLAKVPTKVVEYVKTEYVNKEKWDLEKLKRASKAMGPLGEWMGVQLALAEVFEKAPEAREVMNSKVEKEQAETELREAEQELKQLEAEKQELEVHASVTQAEVQEMQQELHEIKKALESAPEEKMPKPSKVLLQQATFSMMINKHIDPPPAPTQQQKPSLASKEVQTDEVIKRNQSAFMQTDHHPHPNESSVETQQKPKAPLVCQDRKSHASVNIRQYQFVRPHSQHDPQTRVYYGNTKVMETPPDLSQLAMKPANRAIAYASPPTNAENEHGNIGPPYNNSLGGEGAMRTYHIISPQLEGQQVGQSKVIIQTGNEFPQQGVFVPPNSQNLSLTGQHSAYRVVKNGEFLPVNQNEVRSIEHGLANQHVVVSQELSGRYPDIQLRYPMSVMQAQGGNQRVPLSFNANPLPADDFARNFQVNSSSNTIWQNWNTPKAPLGNFVYQQAPQPPFVSINPANYQTQESNLSENGYQPTPDVSLHSYLNQPAPDTPLQASPYPGPKAEAQSQKPADKGRQ